MQIPDRHGRYHNLLFVQNKTSAWQKPMINIVCVNDFYQHPASEIILVIFGNDQ